MKVYFVLKNTFPVGNASTARVYNYCKGLVDLEVECEVVLPIAFEEYGAIPKNKDAEGIYEGIHYKYISGSPQRGKYSALRFVKDKWDYIKTLFYLFKNLQKGDVVVLYEGGCTWFRNLVKVIHMKGAKAVMELNELPYGTNIETPERGLLRKKMLSEVFPLFDGFLSISHSLYNLVSEYAPNGKNLLVPIIVDASIANNVIPFKVNRKYIFHAGTLTDQKDGISGMLEAFAIANRQLGYQLDFISTGYLDKSRDKEKIKEVIERNHISDYVKFVGYLSNEELRSYQAGSCLMIINKLNTLQNKYCFSTKIGEYLAFSKPIIITKIGEAIQYLNDTNAYIAEVNDPCSISQKIVDIIYDNDKAKNIGLNGKSLVECEFSRFYQAKRVLRFFETI